MQTWQVILSTCGILITMAVIIGIFFANAKNSFSGQERRNNTEAVKSYETLLQAKTHEIGQLRDDIKELQKLHTESVRENGKLQGQIDAYAKLPLQEISVNQRIITQAILLIAKHDGIEGVDALMNEINRTLHQ